MTALMVLGVIFLIISVPTWLGLRSAHRMTDGLSHPDRCGITPPGRLIDGGRIMDPDRLNRAVE